MLIDTMLKTGLDEEQGQGPPTPSLSQNRNDNDDLCEIIIN